MKTKKLLAIVAVTMTTAMASFAQARGASGVMLTGNAYMYNQKVETTGVNVETKNSIYDFKLGYLMGSGLYLGGIYTQRSGDDSFGKSDGKSTGASLGYVGSKGFFIKGHYILSSEYGDLKEGTGYQADLGYITDVTGNFIVGVELTYRSIDYKKHETNPAVDKVTLTEMFPMLTIGFVF